MTIEELNLLLRLRENHEVEYKTAKGGFPQSFWESFSAFANTNGGVIVLGVKEKNDFAVVDGLSEGNVIGLKKSFWDMAHNPQKVSCPLVSEGQVHDEVIGAEGWVLVCEVPRADYKLKPVFLNGTPYGNTYKRKHEGDYHCTDDEVRQMFADASLVSGSADGRILKGFGIEDICVATLEKYRREYDRRHEGHPWSVLSNEEFLRRIGAYRVDKESGEEGFTVAGILMFGKSESVTDQRCLPWFYVDYREHLGDDPRERWSDRIYPDGRWEANVYEFFLKALNGLYDALPTPFRLSEDGVTRREYTSAHIALREALANSLIHACYGQMGSIVVDRWRDRIRISNPGQMLVSVDQFYEGWQSVCRNPVLQKMFVFLGVSEKAGSGADTIVKGWEDNHWVRPVIEELMDPDRVEIVLQLKAESLLGDDPTSRPTSSDVTLQANPTSTLQEGASGWSHYVESLVAILGDGERSVKEMMEILDLSDRVNFLNLYLNPAKDLGVIEMTNPEKPKSPKQKYRLTERGRKKMG